MWTRKQIKEKAKARFKVNYWICVLVSLILATMLGSSGGTGSSRGFSNTDREDLQQIESMMNGNLIETGAVESSSDDLQATLNEMLAEIGETNVAVVLIITLTIAIIIGCIVAAFSIFVVNPLIVGCRRFFVKNLNDKAEFSEVGHMFNDHYKNTVKTMFFKELYTFLWSLLLVIPGIVKSYEYRMVPYLTAMNPEMDTKEIFARSKEMMTGNKWKAFVLDLSFIGWELLNICTLGILGLFYLNPYIYQTDAALYEKLNGGSIYTDSRVIEA